MREAAKVVAAQPIQVEGAIIIIIGAIVIFFLNSPFIEEFKTTYDQETLFCFQYYLTCL